MHEFSLAQDVLKIVLDSAAEHGLSTVGEVRLNVGRASGVHVEALNFAWEYLRSTDPRTAECVLELNRPAGQGECPACGFTGEIEDYIRVCPACHALGLRITGGTEFMVTGISGE
jgi:hydrogenase nickel insertion protein HypA